MKAKSFFRPCLDELKWSNCGFSHSIPDDLVRSQWQNRTKNIYYLLYRWLVGIFFVVCVAISMSPPTHWSTYFIYLTNWGILTCCITGVFGAGLVSVWYFHPEYSDNVNMTKKMPTVFKVYWSFHNITLVMAFIITIIYWGILYNDATVVDATNVLTHACNSVIMLLDVLIVAYPIRVWHVVQPIGLGLVYCIFTVIYYAAGGEDSKGNKWIYKVLDWSDAGNAMVTVVGTMFLCIIVHIFLYFVHKARILISLHLAAKKTIIPTTASSSTIVPSSRISMVHSSNGNDNEAFTGSSEKF